MNYNDLMNLTLKEVLEDYVIIQNLECGYTYGIAPLKDVEKIFQDYNINNDYPEAFNPENIISDEVLLDGEKPLLTYTKLQIIMRNLNISKKR